MTTVAQIRLFCHLLALADDLATSQASDTGT